MVHCVNYPTTCCTVTGYIRRSGSQAPGLCPVSPVLRFPDGSSTKSSNMNKGIVFSRPTSRLITPNVCACANSTPAFCKYAGSRKRSDLPASKHCRQRQSKFILLPSFFNFNFTYLSSVHVVSSPELSRIRTRKATTSFTAP